MDLAARRSATLRSKVVMRIGCCLVAVSMVISCWATPRAKAVVSEAAFLGNAFGIALSSLGYSWGSDNMSNTQFGEAIYSLLTDWARDKSDDEETVIRDLSDLVLVGMSVSGPGKIQFSHNLVNLARDFVEWFQSKFFATSNNATVILGIYGLTLSDGNNFLLGTGYYDSEDNRVISSIGTKIYQGEEQIFSNNAKLGFGDTIYDVSPTGSLSKYSSTNVEYIFLCSINSEVWLCRHKIDGTTSCMIHLAYLDDDVVSINSPLTAEKPQEVHYPEVAEDGSQVYEITVDGVTATDIDGIIQGAVDQILAGTAAIAGTVTEAQDVPVEPEAPPELDGLGLSDLGASLTTRFPFSIPWDIALGVQLLAAPAEAPYFEVDFFEPISDLVGGWQGSTKIVLDFSEFEIIGTVCRWTSTIGFCLMLASSTKRFIWVA